VHQVGFSLDDYIEMHGQQNKKKLYSISYYFILHFLFYSTFWKSKD